MRHSSAGMAFSSARRRGAVRLSASVRTWIMCHNPMREGSMKRATSFVLTDVHGAVRPLEELRASGPVLLIFVERDCPTSTAALEALRGAAGNVVVVSEGSPEAARELAGLAGDRTVLVETAPYPVSAAYGLQTVPTFVLVSAEGAERERAEGWDAEAVASMLGQAGGDPFLIATDLPSLKPGCQARNTYDEATGMRLEAEDRAALASAGIEQTWERGWHDGLRVVP